MTPQMTLILTVAFIAIATSCWDVSAAHSCGKLSDQSAIPTKDSRVDRDKEVRGQRRRYKVIPRPGLNVPTLGGLDGDELVKDDLEFLRARQVAWTNQFDRHLRRVADSKLVKDQFLSSLFGHTTIAEELGQRVANLGRPSIFELDVTEDEVFGHLRLSGSPTFLQRATPTTIPFSISESSYGSIQGTKDSFEKALDKGHIFMVNHQNFESVLERFLSPGRYAVPAAALFFVKDRDMVPLAIQLRPNDTSAIYTPVDNTDADWFLAKMFFNQIDIIAQSGYHFAETHVVMEPIGISARRNLASNHPVRGVIDKLFQNSNAIPIFGDETLFNTGGVFDRGASLQARGLTTFVLETALPEYHFAKSTFEGDLKNRGVDKLKYYPYSQDGREVKKLIDQLIDEYLDLYYEKDDILDDVEIQEFARELAEQLPGKGFPGAFDDLKELKAFLGEVMFIVTARHAAMNIRTVWQYGQYPFVPLTLVQPAPSTYPSFQSLDQLLPFLPNLTDTAASVRKLSETFLSDF